MQQQIHFCLIKKAFQIDFSRLPYQAISTATEQFRLRFELCTSHQNLIYTEHTKLSIINLSQHA